MCAQHVCLQKEMVQAIGQPGARYAHARAPPPLPPSFCMRQVESFITLHLLMSARLMSL